ncbi:hypothetical protein [Pseudoalteromonas sp. S16_S37]|nr:hypothetical protein [Pseudoalteromonas sp. S16_S37]
MKTRLNNVPLKHELLTGRIDYSYKLLQLEYTQKINESHTHIEY